MKDFSSIIYLIEVGFIWIVTSFLKKEFLQAVIWLYLQPFRWILSAHSWRLAITYLMKKIFFLHTRQSDLSYRHQMANQWQMLDVSLFCTCGTSRLASWYISYIIEWHVYHVLWIHVLILAQATKKLPEILVDQILHPRESTRSIW